MKPLTTAGDDPPIVPATSRARVRRPRHGIRLALLGEHGVIPGTGAGAALSYALLWKRLRLEVLGVYTPRRSARYPDRPAIGGEIGRTAVAVRACPTPGLRRVGFPLCVGVELGGLRVQGVGVARSQLVREFWAGTTLGPGVAWSPIDRVTLWFSAEVVVLWYRRAYHITGFSPVFRAPAVGFRGFLGLEVQFP